MKPPNAEPLKYFALRKACFITVCMVALGELLLACMGKPFLRSVLKAFLVLASTS